MFTFNAMQFDFGFYSSILLIFFVHGLVYSVLLFRKGILYERNSDKWLSLFLLLCVLFIAPWMLGFGGWYDNQPYRDILFYVPMQHLYFMGPVIFFYVQSLLNPTFRFGKRDWLHLLPGIFYLVYCLVMFVTDKIILKNYYFLADGQDKDFESWYQKTGLISMLFYFFISIRYYNLYKKLMVQVISYADVVVFKWVRNFLTAFLFMQLFQVGFYLIGFIFPEVNSYIGSWWFFFSFAIIFYYIAITGYSNSIETKVSFSVNLLSQNPILYLQSSPNFTSGQHETSEIIEIENEQTEEKEDDALLLEWKSKILELLHSQKIYEDPELSLMHFARQLQTNASIISKVINQGFQLNFNDFINNFRVEAVKEKLKAGEQKKLTLLSIAYDCGFNSKATFNRAFKKSTGLIPKDYIAGL